MSRRLTQAKRARRVFSLDDEPKLWESYNAQNDIGTDLQNLLGNLADLRYAKFYLPALPYRPARVTVNVSGGAITSVTVHDGGWFSITPTVTATGPTGSGAVLTPVMSGNTIASFTVNNGGSLYTAGSTKLLFTITNYAKFSNQLTIPRGLSFDRDSTAWLYYTGSANEAHIIVGDAQEANPEVSLDIAVRRASFSSWNDATEQNDTGILVHNLQRFHDVRLAADGFTQNTWLKSTSYPFAYGEMALGLHRSGRYNLVLERVSSDAWLNQITFRCTGSSFSTDSSAQFRCGYVAGTKYPVGILFKSDNEAHPFNALHFEGYCPEISVGYAESPPVQFEASCTNLSWDNTRHENLTPEFFRHKSGAVQAIDLNLSYIYSSLWDLADMWNSVAGANSFVAINIRDAGRTGNQPARSWKSPNLGTTACGYDNAGRLYVPGFYWLANGTPTRTVRSANTTNTVQSDNIKLTSNAEALGLMIRLNKCRMITCKPMVQNGTTANLRQGFKGWNDGFTKKYAPAYGTATRSGDTVASVTILDGGQYTPSSTVPVTFTGGGGSGATGTATVDVNGVIVSVAINTPGSGYTSNPTPVFTNPAKHWIQGPGFLESSTFYGCYLNSAISDAGHSLWVNSAVRYLEWLLWASGDVYLEGVEITSLDGHPFTVRSTFDGRTCFTTRYVGEAPSGALKGNWGLGQIAHNGAPALAADPWGWRLRALPGTWDALAP